MLELTTTSLSCTVRVYTAVCVYALQLDSGNPHPLDFYMQTAHSLIAADSQ
jgi:hypothetical protein